jgi:AcrR family transcriptional regulator
MRIARAGLQIVVDEGLESVSFRTVAAAADRSVGAVQKVYGTKSELLHGILRLAREEAVSRIMLNAPGTPTLADWLTEMVMHTLPLDAERRAACLVDAAFAQRAPFDSFIAQSIASWDEELRESLTGLIAGHRAAGVIPDTVDPEVAARSLIAFSAGFAVQLLYAPLSEDAARTTVTAIVSASLS